MSTLFHINFRREAYAREIARARRRVFALGAWVAYFGVLTLVLGLYGLNCVAMGNRVRQVERQAARLRASQSTKEWNISQNELNEIERYVTNPRTWRDRLTHLAMILPPNCRITSIAVNPQNASSQTEQNRLVITGVIQATSGDRMQGVMGVVSKIHSDSVFAATYRNIKLASTRMLDGAERQAEFIVECR